jgi:imidazolonepropionase-like amidohydrolase
MAGTTGERYGRLVICNATVVNGCGTPAEGPIDIVIEDGMITDLVKVDPIAVSRYPAGWQRPTGDRVVDAKGMYVIPGLIEMHTHVPLDDKRAGPDGWDYFYRLMLCHGVTTIRTCGFGGEEKLYEHRARVSSDPACAIPRVVVLHPFPRDGQYTPDEARQKVRELAAIGADGIKLIDPNADIFAAICDEARKLGMKGGTAAHLSLSSPVDAVMASGAGVTSIEHTYGIPEAAIPGVQAFPPDYNEMDELARFRQSAYNWSEADLYPERVEAVLDLMIKNGTVWSPNFATYEANRDIGRVRFSQFNQWATPQLLNCWSPTPGLHASFHFDWKTSDEIAWKEKYRIWFKYVKMFFQMGGTLVAGADAGYQYTLYGFSMIRELELFQEAGIRPLDVIKIATTNAARVLGLDKLAGGVRRGYGADLAIVDGNPLDNLKVMYGSGVERFGADRVTKTRGGAVQWTVRDGVLFDARALMRDVEEYVEQQKQEYSPG